MRTKITTYGFTLVELVIIIAVIGSLAVGIITLLDPVAQIQKAQDARRKSDLSEIQKALELYYHDNGRYPPSTSGYRINNLSWGASWTPYMGKLPADPGTPSKTYMYNVSSDGQAYWLYANLARGAKDPQACANGADCPSVPGVNLCGTGANCNFGLSSSNVTP